MNPLDKSIEKDRKFGLANEKLVIEILKSYFNENITPTTGRYCPYDAYSDTTKYEIKTRRNKYNTYPTTIITIKKLNTKGNLKFVFSFTDGLYYIDYDKILFSTFLEQDISYLREHTKPVSHILIPIQLLIKIN